MAKYTVLVNTDVSTTTTSNSIPSSTVTSSIATASTELSTTYSATTTSSTGTIHTSSTSTKTTSSTTITTSATIYSATTTSSIETIRASSTSTKTTSSTTITKSATTYSATTTSTTETIRASSTSTKTTSSTTITTSANNIPTTAPTVQNITSQVTEVLQSTTLKDHVAQNAIDGLLGSFSQTNSGDQDPYIRLLLASTYNVKWVNLVYGDQSQDYRKLDIYVGFNTSYYLGNTFCTSTSSSRKSKFDTFTCSHAGKIGNVIFITSQAGFSGLIRIYELEVFATAVSSDINQPQDITSRGTPSQSSVSKDLKAENAVDGILESYCETDEFDEKPYFQLSFDNKCKVIYIDITYGSTNNDYGILKFYVGNIVTTPSDNTYCNSTLNQLSLNWETVTCQNGGIEGRRLFITCDKMIKVREIKVYGFSL